MFGRARRLIRDERGSVAPTVALSLIGLIAAGGLAVDYAQLANLDTELQNAADQAALAAATQLDREDRAVIRAEAAARFLVANDARFANDETKAAAVANVYFYETADDAEADTNRIDVDGAEGEEGADDPDTLARFVRVTIATRRATYAMTPIIGLLQSPDIGAAAVAGMDSAICKVPPVMMCNPQETATNKDVDISSLIGVGMMLVAGGGGTSAWTPGNFGYLNTGATGANDLEYSLGANNPPGNCLALDGVTTKPGENTSVVNAINTRFDIYQNGLVNACTTGACSPSPNVRKDVIRAEGSTNCGFATGNDPWSLPPASKRYLPDPVTGVNANSDIVMGHPRDICHAKSASGTCTNGKIGDGSWDRNLYFYANHRSLYPVAPTSPNNGWQDISSLVDFADDNDIEDLSTITRYQVYRWEIANNLLGSVVQDSVTKGSNTTNFRSYGAPVCGPAVPASETQLDRRLTAMAVVNCIEQDVKGQSKNVAVKKWVEVFFVEPSISRDRTQAGDVYVEVVRAVDAGANDSTDAQVVRRDKPYLLQ